MNEALGKRVIKMLRRTKMATHFFNRLLLSSLGSLSLLGLVHTSVGLAQAQDSNFGKFVVEFGKRVAVNGSTGGTTSLPAVVGNTDRDRNKCLGFGDPKPDHIMQLKGKFSSLTLKVDSSGKDTTLVVVAPNGEIRCGDDTGSKKDASIRATDLTEGAYKVWVGSPDPGTQINYRLMVQSN
jgi:hypothetical protein